MTTERKIIPSGFAILFPEESEAWGDQVAAASAMIDGAYANLQSGEQEAVYGMQRLHLQIYRGKIGVTSPYEEFVNNAFSIFNGSVTYAGQFPEIPARVITRSQRPYLKFSTPPKGVMNLRDIKLIVDAYGLVKRPIPIKDLGMRGMSNPNHAINEARFQLSLALRDKFKK